MLRLQSANCDIALEDKNVARLSEFIGELILWNQKTNLTAITEPSEVAEKHIIGSLIPAKFIPVNVSVTDLG